MASIHGTVFDKTSGAPVAAKVHVLESTGYFRAPSGAVMKVGTGRPFFYCEGSFEVEVSRGPVEILVERGTEYEPLHKQVYAPSTGHVDVELSLRRWADLPSLNWHPGNTHIHYDEKETQPDERLRLDPHVHDFSVTVVSILERRGLAYKSNRFPLGVMTDISTAHHIVDIGEESRHNEMPWNIGYGHVMFLRIQNLVEPVSRGVLVSEFDPDYPPICFACDGAHEQSGIVLWCHNGNGMEVPVAAGLGKLDGFNLFDPFWMDPEYDIWYRLLNCGFFLPASTGSDWFVCSNNRVYVQTGQEFTYDRWIEGMQRGQTFITNGPALFLEVDGQPPGVRLVGEKKTTAQIVWRSHYPVNVVELVMNGEIARKWSYPEGSREGTLTTDVFPETDGWIAARCSGHARDSFDHSVFAHTSPVWFDVGRPPVRRAEDARFFIRSIDDALGWVARKGRFAKNEQRLAVAELFRRGQAVYEGLVKEG
ncbi:MAG: CehA/McbA family metallohydrolase [candidate division Zixibacteria bacterium]|nr:CehA/McbA family metallohydrolase [candidate division Zixibacteria bacterium]